MFTPEKAKKIFEDTFDIAQICDQLDEAFENYLRYGPPLHTDSNLIFPTTTYAPSSGGSPNHVEGLTRNIPPTVAYRVACAYLDAGWKYVFYNCDMRVNGVMCTHFKLYMEISKVHNFEVDYFTCVQKTDDGKYVESFVSQFDKGV